MSGGRHFAKRSRPKRILRLGALIAAPVAALTLVTGAGFGRTAIAAVLGPDTLAVTVGERTIQVELAARADTVATVMMRNHIPAKPGRLRAIKTGEAIRGADIAPVYLLDGVPVPPDAPVGKAATLVVRDGVDQIEPTMVRDSPVAPPPEPAVIYGLWHPGRPGVMRSFIGVRSKQVVTTRILAPTPPAPVTEKVAAITLDDGPWPDTPQFVQVLRGAGVRASFCMIGRQVPALIDIVHQVSAAGMTVCNHTVDHNMYLDRAPASAVHADIDGGRNMLTSALGRPPAFYRPPGGTLSPEIIATATRDGEQVVHWTLDSMDYRHLSADAITHRVVGMAQPGMIVLMHDGGGDRSQTLAALPRIIALLRAQGYAFATPDTIGPMDAPPSGAVRAWVA